jgi:hypothetical protein
MKELGTFKVKALGQDKQGLYFDQFDVEMVVLQEVMANDNYFMRTRKRMNTQIKEAVNSVEAETKMFVNAIGNLRQQEEQLAELTKKTSGTVRKSANELAEGLIKVEKMADFTRLERYVALLERAALAFDSLAELEKTGKLEKIALAIK